ncbi:MAG TPA: hypothetical protein VKU39_06445 [Streptosporangiaceae bacterium]|nr:hypothetical protein [Streptosporangiaceae bacterium]
MTARIRWEATPLGSPAGHVGTIDGSLFSIWIPPQASGEWVLTSELPGTEGKRCYGDEPEALKAEAERWLEEFVSSLGASFGEPEDAAITSAARSFTETWHELLTGLPDSYDCHMTCGEAEAAADLYRALGDGQAAGAIIAAHAAHDDEGDSHFSGASEDQP